MKILKRATISRYTGKVTRSNMGCARKLLIDKEVERVRLEGAESQQRTEDWARVQELSTELGSGAGLSVPRAQRLKYPHHHVFVRIRDGITASLASDPDPAQCGAFICFEHLSWFEQRLHLGLYFGNLAEVQGREGGKREGEKVRSHSALGSQEEGKQHSQCRYLRALAFKNQIQELILKNQDGIKVPTMEGPATFWLWRIL